MPAPLTDAEALQVLARQQRRREAGTPVLTALVGPAGHGLGVWSDWAAAHGAPTLTLAAGPLAACWLEQAAGLPGVREGLLRALGLTPQAWRERTPYERTRLLHAAGERCETPELPVLLLYFLQDGTPRPASGAQARAALAALARLLSTPACPALGVVPCGPEQASAALEEAALLAWAAPPLPLALVLTPQVAEGLLARPESRALACLREGLVHLAPPALPAAVPAASRARLVRDGASEALWAAFTAAAGAPGARARSLAEAFLFARLESLPATRGLFVLNGKLPFRFGPRPVEVDLLCAPLRLALEVDGWHHFQGEERYRRDRRKDLLLQQHGYQVLRVLAADVVQGLGDVLELVLDAVAHRRTQAERTRSTRGG